MWHWCCCGGGNIYIAGISNGTIAIFGFDIDLNRINSFLPSSYNSTGAFGAIGLGLRNDLVRAVYRYIASPTYGFVSSVETSKGTWQESYDWTETGFTNYLSAKHGLVVTPADRLDYLYSSVLGGKLLRDLHGSVSLSTFTNWRNSQCLSLSGASYVTNVIGVNGSMISIFSSIDGITWTPDDIVTVGYWGPDVCLRAPDDSIHAVLTETAYSEVRLYRKSGGSWSYLTIQAGNPLNLGYTVYTDAAIDRLGNIHIVRAQEREGMRYYYIYAGTDTYVPVDLLAGNEFLVNKEYTHKVNIALDGYGIPYVFYTPAAGGLHAFKWTNTPPMGGDPVDFALDMTIGSASYEDSIDAVIGRGTRVSGGITP
jgi:hypothetical protein